MMNCEQATSWGQICKSQATRQEKRKEKFGKEKRRGPKPRQPGELFQLTLLQKQKIMNHSIRVRPRSFYTNKIQQHKWGPIRNSRHSRQDQKQMLNAINRTIFPIKQQPIQGIIQITQQNEKHYQPSSINAVQPNKPTYKNQQTTKPRKTRKPRSKGCETLQKKEQGRRSNKESSSDRSQDKQIEERGKRRKARRIVKMEVSGIFTEQQADRIIDLFSVDGGNFSEIMKELPRHHQKIKVRNLIKAKCFGAIQEIMRRAQGSNRFTPLTPQQMYEVVREMTRTRANNRLLSELDIAFRESFTKLIRLKHPEQSTSVVSDDQICRLLNRIIQFPRGSKNVQVTPLTQEYTQNNFTTQKTKQIIRHPVKSGGRLLSIRPKQENGLALTPTERLLFKNKPFQSQELLKKWTRPEEVYLAQLYSSSNYQIDLQSTICKSLDFKFGASPKWVDFDRFNIKMSQMVKFALIKLMNLTFVPYSQQQRRRNKARRLFESQEKLKRQNSGADYTYLKIKHEQQLCSQSMFLYDCELFDKKEQLNQKHRIFKDISLLQRQIIGHQYNNSKIKKNLLALLIQQFPSQLVVKQAVQEAKRFSEWALNEDRRGRRFGMNGLQDNQISKKQMEEIKIFGDIEELDIVKKEEVIILEEGGNGMKIETNLKGQSKLEDVFMNLNSTVAYNV